MSEPFTLYIDGRACSAREGETIVDVASREASRIEPILTPGRYQVYCDLFAGTAESHYDLGMVFELEVR